MKTILLLGATGRTGKYVVDYALAQGYHVHALVRNTENDLPKSDNLVQIKGSPYNEKDVLNAIQNCEAVINVLNNPRKTDSPWAESTGPIDIVSRSISNAIVAMKHIGITRIIHMSAFGVGNSFSLSNFILKFLIRKTNMRIAYEDHENAENTLKASGLNWTAVRPAALDDKLTNKKILSSQEQKLPGFPMASISRSNVAIFLVDSLEQSEYSRKAVEICQN